MQNGSNKIEKNEMIEENSNRDTKKISVKQKSGLIKLNRWMRSCKCCLSSSFLSFYHTVERTNLTFIERPYYSHSSAVCP